MVPLKETLNKVYKRNKKSGSHFDNYIEKVIMLFYSQYHKPGFHLSFLTSSTYGGTMSLLDKRRSSFKRNILSRKDARLCMELTSLERQNSDVSKTANILSVSAAELMLQAKPR
jgi:hypothetical protein